MRIHNVMHNDVAFLDGLITHEIYFVATKFYDD